MADIKMQVYRSFTKSQIDGPDSRARKYIADFKNERYFRKVLGFLRQSQWRPGKWHAEYRDRRLTELIQHAVKNVPFYMDVAKESRLETLGEFSMGDLRRFPIVNENLLGENSERFISRAANNGGIPNEPVTDIKKSSPVIFDRLTILEEGALTARHYENAGFKLGWPVVSFVDIIDQQEREWYYCDKECDRHYFSAANLNSRNLPDYCAKIKQLKTGFIFGYPSSLGTFADLILEWEIDLKFQGMVTFGRVLTNEIREKIEKAFETKVYDLYRHRLPVGGMGQCQYCDGYHAFSEFCIVELLDFEGNPVTGQGEMGEIVVTNLSNRAFPVIRYDTGDIGVYDGVECDCGRGMPRIIKAILGSQNELLVNSDGEYIRPDTLRDALSRTGYDLPGYRLVQKDRYHFKLLLDQDSRYEEENLARINECLLDKLGKDSELTIELVDNPNREGHEPGAFIREFDL